MKFAEEYEKLNTEQKEAVEALDGPVMVVAGPGTGKTQVLALRILNILDKGVAEAGEVLCLTFTNSGARAMRARLESFIGSEASKIHISTFHAFAGELVEKYFNYLEFPKMPELLGDDDAVFLIDEILSGNDWEHIRPRTNPEMYFRDLKQLISILKRERISHTEFLKQVKDEIKNLENDEDNISTRGPSAGKLKKEILNKIESLHRTEEVVKFYEIYEQEKKVKGLMDYDDVLEYAVYLVENFDDVRSEIKENNQYVLVDEHQDSSGVQNSFLKAVWQGDEKPNIFVVGDDRQMIYAFSGANIDYFKEFSHIFGKAHLITLTENYRSSEKILDLSHSLLKSSIVDKKLNSNIKENYDVLLNEYAYPRDEILGAGIYLKQKIAEGVAPEECAILVPKNYHARSAINILYNMGLPVAKGKTLSLFEINKTHTLFRLLNIVADPYNSINLTDSVLDISSKIPAMEAHKFLKSIKADKLNIEDMKGSGGDISLFSGVNAVVAWGEVLENFVNTYRDENISNTISGIGNFLIDGAESHEHMLEFVEITRTMLHLAEMYSVKHDSYNLKEFLVYLSRLQNYGAHIGVATFGSESGIKVMTLHSSKGLEYKCVWIAHMNEETLMSEKRMPFTLPERIKEHISKKDKEIAKRELYVAITRAKEFCTISFAQENYTGGVMKLAEVISELPETHFIKKSAEETETELFKNGPKIFVQEKKEEDKDMHTALIDFVRENYAGTKVSVTLLNNFFECPWKWYFRNFLKLPEVKGASLALGSAVHETIEMILKEPKLPNAKKIEEKILYELNKELKDQKEIARLAKDAKLAVENFTNNFYKNISPKFQSERPVQFRDERYPHLLMYGKIDLTEWNDDGGVSVTDFKTGGSKTTGVIEKVDEEGRLSSLMRQLAMYTYLVGGADKKKVSTSRLLFLEADSKDKNAIYSTYINEEQIDLLIRDIKEYDETLKSGTWTKRECLAKSWGKNAECEYCKRAEIYK